MGNTGMRMSNGKDCRIRALPTRHWSRRRNRWRLSLATLAARLNFDVGQTASVVHYESVSQLDLPQTWHSIAKRRLRRLNAWVRGILMEVFGARRVEVREVWLEANEASDALVGIYAHRYGHVPLRDTR